SRVAEGSGRACPGCVRTCSKGSNACAFLLIAGTGLPRGISRHYRSPPMSRSLGHSLVSLALSLTFACSSPAGKRSPGGGTGGDEDTGGATGTGGKMNGTGGASTGGKGGSTGGASGGGSGGATGGQGGGGGNPADAGASTGGAGGGGGGGSTGSASKTITIDTTA